MTSRGRDSGAPSSWTLGPVIPYLGEPGLAGTGHIPGAPALPYQELVDGATGLFQSPAAIRRLVVAAGIDPDAPPAEIVATCGIGVSATVALIALELVGVRVSGVYDGAWTEWSADPARPVAYGQTPRSAAPHTLARNLSPAPAAVSPGASSPHRLTVSPGAAQREPVHPKRGFPHPLGGGRLKTVVTIRMPARPA